MIPVILTVDSSGTRRRTGAHMRAAVLLIVLGLSLTSATDSADPWGTGEEKYEAHPPDFSPNVHGRTDGALRCIHKESCAFFQDKLLVVKLNPVRLHWLDFLQRFYAAGMPNVVFFSSLRRGSPHDGGGQYLQLGRFNTTVALVEDNYGFCDHYTVATAMTRYANRFAGFVFLSDDVMLQYWRLTNLDVSKVWRQRPVYGEKAAGIAMGPELKAALREMHESAPKGAFTVDMHAPPFASTSGVYYVPASLANVFVPVSKMLLKHRTYNEYGTPIVLHAAGGKNFVTLPGALVWGKKRLRARKMLSDADLWQHPVRATGELFARATVFLYTTKDLVAQLPLRDRMFDETCLSCASYPSAGRKMKAIYHSCVASEHQNDCVLNPTQAALKEWPELRAPEQCGGKVHVPPERSHTKCPFELQHEGFWGKSITNYVFEEYYPHINRTRLVSRLFDPFPTGLGFA